ncbi:hypothetical protein NSK_001283 [Nannochloropsis salina CCMP1776]|uniref:F-box domain-containing protein n=1 Tax=Nannochloropsis salina CCMP1776 TaxID=1027361 RepID=A0A4D9DC05_9STRA|nr:hypothetical protein NSK_001283 [Nannochloropsis salina CCMP1776]|eukprot:TFJ87937.1 hypothetical protein NSK_001283 [Nannochloropsis salina CCMP1776]
MTNIGDQEQVCGTLASDKDVDRKLWGMRPPSSTSWARLSGAADLLSTIFRFLQLRELNAIACCGSHACMLVARDEDVWKEIALRMWGRMVDAREEVVDKEASFMGVPLNKVSLPPSLPPSLMGFKEAVKTMASSWPTEWDVAEMASEGLHKISILTPPSMLPSTKTTRVVYAGPQLGRDRAIRADRPFPLRFPMRGEEREEEEGGGGGEEGEGEGGEGEKGRRRRRWRCEGAWEGGREGGLA